MVGGGGGGCEGEVTGRAVAGRTARARGAHPTSTALGERTYPSRLSLMNAHLSPFISSSTVSPTFMVGASFFSGRAGGGGAPGSPPSSVIVRRWRGERCPRCDATRPCGYPRVTTAPCGSRSPPARRASAALRPRRPEVLTVCRPICAKLLPLSSPPALFTLKRTHARRRRLPLDGYRRAHAEAPRVPRVDSPDRHPDTRRLARPDGRART